MALKTIAFAAPTKWLKSLNRQLIEEGYSVQYDGQSGTCKAYAVFDDESVTVLKAFQHHSGLWCVSGDPRVFTEVEA